MSDGGSARVRWVVLALVGIAAGPAEAGFLSDYNVIVGGNLNSNSRVGGRALVTGSLVGGSSSDYGMQLQPPSAYRGVDSLQVGGNVNVPNGNFNIGAGNVRIGGSVLNNGRFNMNGGGTVVTGDTSVAGLAAAAVAEMRTASAYFAGLPAGATIVGPTQPSNVVFNAVPNADGIAVFNVDGSIFRNQNVQQFLLALGPGVTATTTFLFNVTGTAIDFTQGNFGPNFMDPARRPYMLWNFADATSINLQRQFYGSILAPNATLTNQQTVSGSVFVGGDLIQRAPIELPNYAGALAPAAVPEPSSLALLSICGLGGGVAAWRKRKKAAAPQAAA